MDTSDLTQHASSSADWLVFSLSFFEPNNQSGIFHLESEKLLALNSNTKLLSWIELNLKKKKKIFWGDFSVFIYPKYLHGKVSTVPVDIKWS